jgi:hypothetical protein
MRAPLHPTLPPGPGESPQSFVSRLAALNWIPSMRTFCTDLGLRFQPIINGDEEGLENLAYLSGAPLETLVHNALRRDGHHFHLREERISRGSMRRDRLYVCPRCLAQDVTGSELEPHVAAYGRTIWLIEHIRTCPTHGVPLIEASPAGKGNVSHDFALRVGPRVEALIETGSSAPARGLSALERYLIERLDRPLDRAFWPDTLEFSVAARTCEIIGSVVTRGREPKAAKMTDDDWWTAGEAGFRIAAGGEDAIRALLDELQRTFPDRKHNTGPQAEYGAIYKRLQFEIRDPAYDPVRDIVRRHIIARHPVGPGDLIMGQPVEKRLVHSIYSASPEIGIHPKKLRKLLLARGFMAQDESDTPADQVMFDAGIADLIADSGAVDGLPQRDIAEYLNADRVHAKLLTDSGIIPPVAGTGAEGVNALYAKSELDRFLKRLLADAVPVPAPPEGACPIPKAAKHANCSAMEIVRLILERKLAWVGRQAGEPGYLSVLVNYAEIRRLVRGPTLDGLTAEQIIKTMRTTYKVVNALIAAGHLPTRTVINPLNRCPVDIVSREDFSAFQARYATLFELAREAGIHHLALKARLVAQGIEPAFHKEVIGATFYRRSDVEKTV